MSDTLLDFNLSDRIRVMTLFLRYSEGLLRSE